MGEDGFDELLGYHSLGSIYDEDCKESGGLGW